MKKLLVVLFVFAIVGGYVFGEDSASLSLSGNVVPVFRVYLNDGLAGEGAAVTGLQLVDADGLVFTGAQNLVTLSALTNLAATKISLSSTWTLALDGGEAGDVVSFQITVDGEVFSADGDITDIARGRTDFGMMTFAVNETVNEYPKSGTYNATVTFTVAAN